jgi:hypothetical protein
MTRFAYSARWVDRSRHGLCECQQIERLAEDDEEPFARGNLIARDEDHRHGDTCPPKGVQNVRPERPGIISTRTTSG